jgi:hypothetical protein
MSLAWMTCVDMSLERFAVGGDSGAPFYRTEVVGNLMSRKSFSIGPSSGASFDSASKNHSDWLKWVE